MRVNHSKKLILSKDKDKYYSVGSFGDVAAWSFCQDKILTTGGEGGMVTTNKKELFKKIWSIKDHGKSYELTFKNNQSHSFRWLHENFGSNMRLTEMQSAIGRIQLKKLKEWNIKRDLNAKTFNLNLYECESLRIPMPQKEITHAWYRFYCYLNLSYLSSGWSRDRIIEEINKAGVLAYSGSCSEIYLEKCFINILNKDFSRLNNAKELGETSLCFLVHPTLSKEDIKEQAEIIKKIILKAQK